MQIPELEGLVLGGCDEHGLGGVEGESANTVEVTAQGVLRAPGLSKCLFRSCNLKKNGMKNVRSYVLKILVNIVLFHERTKL